MMVVPALRVAVVLGLGLPLAMGCRKPSGDPVVSFDSDDPEMNGAIAESRRRWPEFLQAYEARAPGQRFNVKYPFKVKRSTKNEHIWIGVTAIRDGHVTGTIDNEPDNDIGHANGESVTVPVTGLSDWLYIPNGASEKDFAGGFTVKVVLAREKK